MQIKLKNPIICIDCNGAGVQGGIGGFFACPKCKGTKYIKIITMEDIRNITIKIQTYSKILISMMNQETGDDNG